MYQCIISHQNAYKLPVMYQYNVKKQNVGKS